MESKINVFGISPTVIQCLKSHVWFSHALNVVFKLTLVHFLFNSASVSSTAPLRSSSVPCLSMLSRMSLTRGADNFLSASVGFEVVHLSRGFEDRVRRLSSISVDGIGVHIIFTFTMFLLQWCVIF